MDPGVRITVSDVALCAIRLDAHSALWLCSAEKRAIERLESDKNLQILNKKIQQIDTAIQRIYKSPDSFGAIQ